jgi:hypothetical protein
MARNEANDTALPSGGTIIWLNGAFGVGKSTTALELRRLLPDAVLFDPEEVGYMLRRIVPQPRGGFGFQDLPPWRPLVVHTAVELLRHLKAPLVAPMTLLREDYAREIFDGLGARGISVHHVLLHVEEAELRRRIEAYKGPEDEATNARTRAWRLGHVSSYGEALSWLRANATIVDTTALPPERVARAVVDTLR